MPTVARTATRRPPRTAHASNAAGSAAASCVTCTNVPPSIAAATGRRIANAGRPPAAMMRLAATRPATTSAQYESEPTASATCAFAPRACANHVALNWSKFPISERACAGNTCVKYAINAAGRSATRLSATAIIAGKISRNRAGDAASAKHAGRPIVGSTIVIAPAAAATPQLLSSKAAAQTQSAATTTGTNWPSDNDTQKSIAPSDAASAAHGSRVKRRSAMTAMTKLAARIAFQTAAATSYGNCASGSNRARA